MLHEQEGGDLPRRSGHDHDLARGHLRGWQTQADRGRVYLVGLHAVDERRDRTRLARRGEPTQRSAARRNTTRLCCSTSCGSPPQLPPFVVAVKTMHEPHACHHLGCPVQLPSSLSLPHASTLPSTYIEICDHQLTTLRRTYCRLYCSHSHSPTPARAAAARSTVGSCGVCGIGATPLAVSALAPKGRPGGGLAGHHPLL